MSEQNCIECGQNIEHKRKDAKYCSARCRMRNRRAESSGKLIQELVKLCAQIPNHVVQSDDKIQAVVIRDATSGDHQKINAKTLKDISNKELKHLIKLKTREVYAYKLLNGIKI